MKSLGSTENIITKNKNDENVLHLEVAEVELSHCYIVTNIVIISKIKGSYKHLFQINYLVVY